MSIERAIVEWAITRPDWQRATLKSVALGHHVGEEDLERIVERILSKPEGPAETLAEDDLPTKSDIDVPVQLLSLSGMDHVNALLGGQTLNFKQDALTVVFGDNGSGKSGYARLIKQFVRARHTEAILTDVFSDAGKARPRAVVDVQIGDKPERFAWPSEVPDAVTMTLFFDEPCGKSYIESETEVTYRPRALTVLDSLIEVCDRVRGELDRRISAAETGAVLPELPTGTKAAAFLEQLNGETTGEDIEKACLWGPADEGALQRAQEEHARLVSTNPTKEKARLETLATQWAILDNHLTECIKVLGDEAIGTLADLTKQVTVSQEAAQLASREAFREEPLPRVGSDAWRELWTASREFFMQSCPGDHFPPQRVGDRCPLCQQVLDEDAIGRLARFDAFVRNETEQRLRQTIAAVERVRVGIRHFEVQPATVIKAIGAVLADGELAAEYQLAFQAFQERKTSLLNSSDESASHDTMLAGVAMPSGRALERAKQATEKAEAIDDSTFSEAIRANNSAQAELYARRRLHESQCAIVSQRDRLKTLDQLQLAKKAVNTSAISRKAAELTRAFVTAEIQDRFIRECDRLHVERVTLKDLGGEKGSLIQVPSLLGALQPAPLSRVLSEGEKTALALAGLFTEAYFESSKSAIVVDDPVSSLDHSRRGLVAQRLAQFARERQVIVFTHDVSLVVDLRKAAEDEQVEFCERAIERRPSGEPGVCRTEHPWKAKSVNERFPCLDQELARIRREMNDWDQATYDRNVAGLAGMLSETLERMISLGIAGRVFDQGKQEVKPLMLKVLVKFDANDDQEFQSLYSQVSRWAPRHDKAISLNYVAPMVDELESALKAMRAFWTRVDKYKS